MAFRVTPDAVMTHYKFSNAPSFLLNSQYDVNFAISVGMEYKFTSIKRSTKRRPTGCRAGRQEQRS